MYDMNEFLTRFKQVQVKYLWLGMGQI